MSHREFSGSDAAEPIRKRAARSGTLLSVTLRALGEVQRGERGSVEIERPEATAILVEIQELRRDLGDARARAERLKSAKQKTDERADELREVIRRGRELLEQLGGEA